MGCLVELPQPLLQGLVMLGDRLINLGGAKLVGALALAVIVLVLLLGLSVWGNVLQFRGKATAVGQVLSRLAAAEARSKAEIEACAATNARAAGTVAVLEAELLQCRGQQQDMAGDLALARRERDRARRAVTAEIQQRQTTVQLLVDRNESCAPRPLCRAVSDELLHAAPDGPAQ